MIDIIQRIGFSHQHDDRVYIAVPLSIGEPEVGDIKTGSACPVASARGASNSQELLDNLTRILSRNANAASCPQCEGVWFFSAAGMKHISGDTIARLDNAIEPDRHERIMRAYRNNGNEPPKERYGTR